MSIIFSLITLNYNLHSTCKSDCQNSGFYYLDFDDFNPFFFEGHIPVEKVNKFYNSNYEKDYFQITGEHNFSDLALPYIHAKHLDPYIGPLEDFPYRSNLFPLGNLIIYIFTIFSYKSFFLIYLFLSFGLYFYSNYLWLSKSENSILYSLIFTSGTYPFLFAIDRGNLESLIAPLISISFYLIVKNKKELFSCLLFIISVSFKGIHIIFFYLFFYLRKFKLLALNTLVFIILNFISLLFFKSPVFSSLTNYLEASSKLMVSVQTEFNTSLFVFNNFLITFLSNRVDSSVGFIFKPFIEILHFINSNFFLVSLIMSIYFCLFVYMRFKTFLFRNTISFLTISILYINLFTALGGLYRLIFLQICLLVYIYEMNDNLRYSKILDLYFLVSVFVLFPYKFLNINLHPILLNTSISFLLFTLLIHLPKKYFKVSSE